MHGIGRQRKLKPCGPSGRVSSTLTSGTMKTRTKKELVKLWEDFSQYVFHVDTPDGVHYDEKGWWWSTPDSDYNGPFDSHSDARNDLFDTFCLGEGYFLSRGELRRFKQSMLDSGAHI